MSSDATGATWTGTERVTFTNVASTPLAEVYLRLWDNYHGSCPSNQPIKISNVTGGTAGALEVACTAVKITLPAPQLSQAALDMERSYVVAEERGLLNRIGDAFKSDPNQQQRVYQEAQKRITEAAQSSGLDQRARDNTQKMLESLLARLGYTSVTVEYANP